MTFNVQVFDVQGGWQNGLCNALMARRVYSSTASLMSLIHWLPWGGPQCMWAEWVKGHHATRRTPGTSSAWQSRASCLGFPHPFPGLAARNQGERDSQGHLPLQASFHVTGRLSACLCGKEAGSDSILFHSRHEPCPTDIRSKIRSPQQQLLRSRGSGKTCARNTPGFCLPQKPGKKKQQEARTALRLHGDLGQVRNSLCLHFSPTIKWR